MFYNDAFYVVESGLYLNVTLFQNKIIFTFSFFWYISWQVITSIKEAIFYVVDLAEGVKMVHYTEQFGAASCRRCGFESHWHFVTYDLIPTLLCLMVRRLYLELCNMLTRYWRKFEKKTRHLSSLSEIIIQRFFFYANNWYDIL